MTFLSVHIAHKTGGFISENVKAGSFELISAAGSDVNVVLKENPVLINESGASMRFDFFSISRNISSNGNHQISLEGKITDRQHLIGQYKGSVTAVVDYL